MCKEFCEGLKDGGVGFRGGVKTIPRALVREGANWENPLPHITIVYAIQAV